MRATRPPSSSWRKGLHPRSRRRKSLSREGGRAISVLEEDEEIEPTSALEKEDKGNLTSALEEEDRRDPTSVLEDKNDRDQGRPL